MKVSGKILLCVVVSSGFLALRCGATVYHSNGSAANVQQIHNAQAVNGDTITIPWGTFTWATPVTISKAIKLQGQGSGRIIGNTKSQVTIGTGAKWFTTTRVIPGIVAGQTLRIAKMPPAPARNAYMEGTVTSYAGTTLVMNITSTGGSGTYKFWWIATRPATAIINNCASGSSMIDVRQPNTASVEISGIQAIGAANGSTSVSINASTYSGPKTLVHDCWFQSAAAANPFSIQTNRGLVWNCSFDDVFSLNSAAFQAKMESTTMEPSWSTNSTMGMADTNGATNFYIEDCDFHAYLNAADFDSNARVVFRHNTLDNSGLGSHGADTSVIGLRHIEIYDNELIFDNLGDCDGSVTLNLNWFFWMRGGSGVITDNILSRISSCAWGNKENILFSVLNTRRNTGPYCCWTNYPAPHQIGQGYGNGAVFHQYTSQCGPYAGDDYSYYTYAEPVYVWNNSGTAGNSTGLNEDNEDPCGHNQHAANWVANGRDYIIGPKPGYRKFTYPHPLRTTAPRAVVADFNGDGHPDYVLQNVNTRQTAIWYLNNNVYVSGAYAPTLPAGWALRGLADFNGDSHSDYALLAPSTHQTALWYLSGPTYIAGAYGPTIPNGWELVGTADFNGDNKPDYVLYNSGTHQTAIWYLNNNVYIGGGFGPTLPSGWALVGVADFDGDGHPDYVLFHPRTGYTAIAYLSGLTLVGAAWGPNLPSGWALVATGDFNGDGKPDYVLYNAGTRQTAILYLNNNVYVSSAFGPTLPAGWGWLAP